MKVIRNHFEIFNPYESDAETCLDVPFVPTDEQAVEAMLDLAAVGPDDVLYDLGSGDGRIVVAAARNRNTRGIGIDIDPMRVAEAMEYAGYSGVEYLVDFIEDDLFSADIREATVVTLYLLQSINVSLRPRLLRELRPGTRIVSHAFDMGDWRPDDWLELGGINIMKWVVPARVAGTWEWTGADGVPYRVELKQKYQEVTGSAWRDGRSIAMGSAELLGERLELVLGNEDETGAEVVTLVFAGKKLKSASHQPQPSV